MLRDPGAAAVFQRDSPGAAGICREINETERRVCLCVPSRPAEDHPGWIFGIELDFIPKMQAVGHNACALYIGAWCRAPGYEGRIKEHQQAGNHRNSEWHWNCPMCITGFTWSKGKPQRK